MNGFKIGCGGVDWMRVAGDTVLLSKPNFTNSKLSCLLRVLLFCCSMSTCHRQTHFVFQNCVTSQCIVVLFGTSLSGYSLINVPRTTANDSVRSNVRE
jgi:hypothetical protein